MSTADGRVICMHCSHWSPKKVTPVMARNGFGLCAPLSQGCWQMFAGQFPKVCAKHQRAPDETIAARERFAAAQTDQPEESTS